MPNVKHEDYYGVRRNWMNYFHPFTQRNLEIEIITCMAVITVYISFQKSEILIDLVIQLSYYLCL